MSGLLFEQLKLIPHFLISDPNLYFILVLNITATLFYLSWNVLPAEGHTPDYAS